MKYTDLTIEQARQICKKHRYECKDCPLRREKEDKNKKLHLLFCYWMVKNLVYQWKELEEEIDNEEIKYEEELKRELEDMNK